MAQGRVARVTRPVFDCSNRNLSELPPAANAATVTALIASETSSAASQICATFQFLKH
jgi:hypothetical protein